MDGDKKDLLYGVIAISAIYLVYIGVIIMSNINKEAKDWSVLNG